MVAAAILLEVLGVSDEDILDDYELTSRYRRADALAEALAKIRESRNVAPEVAAGVMKTPRWALESALGQLASRYGGADGYLTGPGGADPVVPGRLREILLDRRPERPDGLQVLMSHTFEVQVLLDPLSAGLASQARRLDAAEGSGRVGPTPWLSPTIPTSSFSATRTERSRSRVKR